MEKDKQKTSRASQTRVKEQKKTTWTPPSTLDAPPAPAGYRHRWIRAELLGQDDSKNVGVRLREGFEFVRADSYPEQNFPTSKEGRYAGIIGVGGLLLARIPEELAKARVDYQRKLTEGQDEAVETDLLREQHKSMPIDVDRQSRVTFGGTKKS